MNAADHPRWYVEDAIAHQRLLSLADDAEAIRLDRPGWRDVAAAGTAATGLVVGAETRVPDLAAALADLARGPATTLVLPADGGADAAWTVACTGWRLQADPEVRDDLLVLQLGPTGPGPTLATITSLHHRRGRATLRRRAPWRVELLDATAEAWFGDVTASTNRPVLQVRGADGDGAHDRVRVARTAPGDDAEPLAARVVADDPLLADEGVQVMARPVDLRRFSPVGCDPRGATGAPVLPISADGHADGIARARTAAQEVVEQVADAATDQAQLTELAVTGDGTPSGRDLHALREAVALLDHPDVHASPAHHARWLLCAVAAGVPVLPLAPLPAPVAGLVGQDVADALAATTVDDVRDPDLRERASVLQRRQVLAAHTSTTRLRQLGRELGLRVPRPRTVTVVLATNRESFLDHACTQIARQDWPALEVVVVTHADLPKDAPRRFVDEHLGHLPTTLLQMSPDHSLGEALNLAIEHASGELVTKMDDDDWYAPTHVTDVVTALDYSGADVAGKGAEFLYLAGADTTVRRWGRGGERPSTTIAGATLTFPREVWRDIAGFPHVSLAEDRGFVEEVVAAGGTSHRGTPFGFLVNRHGQHAWAVTDEEFLGDAVATRAGLDHDWTLT